MTFNVIDILLVVLVLLSVLNGWRRGFIRGVLDLLGWMLSLVAGLRFYQPVARWLGSRVGVLPEVWDRPVAFILAGEMAIAFFRVHLPRGFWTVNNMGEPAVLNCFIFLYLAVAGGGAWSVDRLWRRSPQA